jgi:hypothetical protein
MGEAGFDVDVKRAACVGEYRVQLTDATGILKASDAQCADGTLDVNTNASTCVAS